MRYASVLGRRACVSVVGQSAVVLLRVTGLLALFISISEATETSQRCCPQPQFMTVSGQIQFHQVCLVGRGCVRLIIVTKYVRDRPYEIVMMTAFDVAASSSD